MKKWLYLVLPVVMAVVFTVFYVKHDKETVVREQTRATEIAKKAAAEKAVKDAAEAKAKESARIAQEAREKEDADREAARKAVTDANDKEIKDKTDTALAEAESANRKAKQLEGDLDRLQKDKERVTREAFDNLKRVEMAMVAKRNAEMEEQRLTEMIARRAGDSNLARVPLPPPPPPTPPTK